MFSHFVSLPIVAVWQLSNKRVLTDWTIAHGRSSKKDDLELRFPFRFAERLQLQVTEDASVMPPSKWPTLCRVGHTRS